VGDGALGEVASLVVHVLVQPGEAHLCESSRVCLQIVSLVVVAVLLWHLNDEKGGGREGLVVQGASVETTGLATRR
jgi:hypothetical protein